MGQQAHSEKTGHPRGKIMQRKLVLDLFAKVIPSVVHKRRILVYMIALGFRLAAKGRI